MVLVSSHICKTRLVRIATVFKMVLLNVSFKKLGIVYFSKFMRMNQFV